MYTISDKKDKNSIIEQKIECIYKNCEKNDKYNKM